VSTSGDRHTVRKPWLDVAKGLSILAVVLFHAGSASPEGTTARHAWQLVGLGLFTFIMPLFFLVSGLVLGKGLNLTFKQYLRKKVWPAFYLFVVWTVIYAIINFLSGGLVGGSLLDSLALQTVLWYLAALCVYMLVAWLTRRLPTPVVLAVAALVAVPSALFFPFDGWGLAHAPHFMVFFLAGCRLTAPLTKAVETARWRHLGYLALVAVAFGAIAVVLPSARSLIYALTPLISVPLVLIVSMWLSRHAALSRQVEKLGVGSLAIFVIHILVLSLVGLFLVPLLEPVVIFQWLLPLLATALAVGAAMLVWSHRRHYRFLFHPPWPSSTNPAETSIR
jgi:fucose 4-O-acetylase-like acetyltransferase